MRRRRASLAALVLAAVLAGTSAMAPSPAAAAPVTVEEAYRLVESGSVRDAQDAERIAREVRPALEAAGDQHGQDLLERLIEAPSAETRRRASAVLAEHLRSLASLDTTVRKDAPQHDPALLERILVEEGVAPGSAAHDLLRRLQRRLLGWLETVAMRIFGSKAASSGARAAYYLVLALSALVGGWLAWRVVRALFGRAIGGRAPHLDVGGGHGPVVEAARDLPLDALAYAEAEASAGRFREAVRALFGGAARWLAERGAIPAARTRTTAEILRDVKASAPAAHPALAAIAGIFEPAWYGHEDPGPDGYAAARRAYLEVTTSMANGSAKR